MKRHRRTNLHTILCALALVFLVLNGCGADNGGGGPVAVTYNISGQVTSAGSGVSGVTMTLSGASSATVITDANGDYTFTGLDNGSYTITPSRTGFIFSPTDNTQTVSGADITGVNFTATPVQPVTYSISGTVMSGAYAPGISGVTMTLTGANSATTITDGIGMYAFVGLNNGSYTITPTSTGFIFGPTSSTLTVSGADMRGIDFLAFGLPAPQVITCPPSGTTNVTIQDFSFTPTNVVISANGIVKWTNNGTTHTVTSGTSTVPIGLFDTGNIGTGETACIQFPRTGIFVYSCTIHPTMTGGVVVQ